MPRYSWLLDKKVNYYELRKKLSVLRMLGVPYTDEQVAEADRWAENQAQLIVEDLAKEGIEVKKDRQIVALIAYIQSLGQKSKNNEDAKAHLELVPKTKVSQGGQQ